MPVDYYIALIFLVIWMPALAFFGLWWNHRHGLDEEGKSDKPLPRS